MFRLSNYWALGLLILIPYAFYLSKKSLAELSSWRRWSTFGLRSAVILMLVLALAGFELVWKVDRLCVIYVLDVSNSIPEDQVQLALSFIGESTHGLEETDEAGLIVFGKEAYVELPPQMNPEIKRISSAPSREYTNLAAGVRTALDLFPEASQKRIVLITDGNENVGDMLNEAEIAASGGVQIYTAPLSTRGTGTDEVLMDGLRGPGSVDLGRYFELGAIVESTVDTTATLKLFRDRRFLTEQRVQLWAAKKNVFHLQQKLDSEGAHVFEALIEPSIDTMRENNSAKALVTVGGKPEVLYMADNESGAAYLYETLVRKDVEVILLTDPARLPASLSEMQNYSAVILDNVPADSLSTAQMKMMESYVHDLGGGLVMIGGENSFGSGYYHDTPIEDALPVKMIPERRKRSLSIVLAIDRSGSMAVPSGKYVKLDLAKEAAVSVVEFLTEKDQVGVIAFDAEAEEIVRLDKVRSKGKIEDKIATIRAKGGTNIYPALEIAHGWLRDADTQLKHVILVSDGKSERPDDLYPLISRMAQDKITVSTIAIGADTDKEMMWDIKDLGRGRYYETNDPGNLPRIFVKEALVASKLIMEGDFRPVTSGDSEILKGVGVQDPGSHSVPLLPILRGYIVTSPEDSALVSISSEAGDPILATWQYGLGRSMAFTSDARPKWAVKWLEWGDFSKFWSQAIGWSLSVPSGEFHALTNIAGNTGYVAVDAVDAKGRFRNFLDFQANVVRPDLEHENIALRQSGPGRYEANFDAGQMGTYLVRVSEMRDGEAVNSQNTGVVTSYSPEYRDMETNHSLLQSLAEATGGKFRPKAGEVAVHGESNVWRLQELWHLLVLLSIPLFFLDVILRRITISKEQISRLKGGLLFNRDKSRDSQAKTLINLKHRKEGIWGDRTQDRGMGVIENQQDEQEKERQAEEENVPVSPSVSRSTPSSAADSEETYTSRLLKAKKRAKQSSRQ